MEADGDAQGVHRNQHAGGREWKSDGVKLVAHAAWAGVARRTVLVRANSRASLTTTNECRAKAAASVKDDKHRQMHARCKRQVHGEEEEREGGREGGRMDGVTHGPVSFASVACTVKSIPSSTR